MNIRIRPKPPAELAATRLLQQTALWGRIKRKLGWKPLSFDLEFDGSPAGDILILLRELGAGDSVAYVPFGPEELPVRDCRGLYLAALSAELRSSLGRGCLFVRWDLPWLSPYAKEDDRYDDKGCWLGPPEPRLRELRMNWGVPEVGLRKAPSDILPPDTMIVDLRGDEEKLLMRMKPKTRYNIRLAERRYVRVRPLPLQSRLRGQPHTQAGSLGLSLYRKRIPELASARGERARLQPLMCALNRSYAGPARGSSPRRR